MNQLIIDLWVIVLLTTRIQHVVEAFAPSHFLPSYLQMQMKGHRVGESKLQSIADNRTLFFADDDCYDLCELEDEHEDNFQSLAQPMLEMNDDSIVPSNDRSISTTSKTVSTPSVNTPSVNNTQFRDTSELTIDELKMIAFRKGYDTVGMDREGLEMIANYLDVEEDFSVEGYPPEEVDPASLAEGFPLFGSIPRGMEEQTHGFDMVPNSYNCLKTADDSVYADLDMTNNIENSQPQNPSQVQSIQLETPPAQSQQIWSDSDQSQSQSSELSKLQVQSKPLKTALLKSPSVRAFVVGFITGAIAVSPNL